MGGILTEHLACFPSNGAVALIAVAQVRTHTSRGAAQPTTTTGTRNGATADEKVSGFRYLACIVKPVLCVLCHE